MICDRCGIQPINKNDDEFTVYKKKSFMKKYAPEVVNGYCDDCFNGFVSLIESFSKAQRKNMIDENRFWNNLKP